MDNFVLTKAVAMNVGTLISGKGDLCEPWDFYPMFEEYEQAKQEKARAEYREGRRRWADEFNKRRQQGMT